MLLLPPLEQRPGSSHSFLHYNRVLFAPVRMVTVPPRHYCIVANPVSRDAQSLVLFDTTGQVRLRHADQEIRLAQDPFPLYPGEVLEKVPGFPPLSQTLPALPLLLGFLTAFHWENNGPEGRAKEEGYLQILTRGKADSLPLHSNYPTLHTHLRQTCPCVTRSMPRCLCLPVQWCMDHHHSQTLICCPQARAPKQGSKGS